MVVLIKTWRKKSYRDKHVREGEHALERVHSGKTLSHSFADAVKLFCNTVSSTASLREIFKIILNSVNVHVSRS